MATEIRVLQTQEKLFESIAFKLKTNDIIIFDYIIILKEKLSI